MHVALTEAQRELRDAVRAFARDRVAPAAAAIDKDGGFPKALVAEVASLGVLGCFVPEAHGGAGLDTVAFAVAVEELARASAAVGAIVAAHAALAVWPIREFGTDAQQARWLPPLARGDALGCWAFPDLVHPDALPPILARREAQDYVLNGFGSGVPNGPDAQLAVVFASIDGKRGGDFFAPFLVETDGPWWAVDVEPRMGLVGARSGRIALTYCRKTREDRLGVETSGHAIARRVADLRRIAEGALAVGVARAALEDALAYAQDRRLFGQALIEFQGTQWRVADMALAVEAARLLVLRAASLQDRGVSYTREAATARRFAADTAMTLATQAVQIHGGYGYTREFAVERHFRDASVLAGGAVTAADDRAAVAAGVLREAGA